MQPLSLSIHISAVIIQGVGFTLALIMAKFWLVLWCGVFLWWGIYQTLREVKKIWKL